MKIEKLAFYFKLTTVAYTTLTALAVLNREYTGGIISGFLLIGCLCATLHLESTLKKEKIQETLK